MANEKAISLQISEIWIQNGNNQAKTGDMDGAIESYEKALQYRPDYYKAWFNRGFAFFKLKRFEDAIESYEKALQYKSDYYKAWYNAGFALFKLGRFPEAIESYEKALQYKSDYYEAWFNRGGTFLKQGRYEEAISSFKQGLIRVSRKDNPEGWGMLHRGKGDIYFHQAQRNPNTQIARVQYGQALTFYNIARQALETSSRLYLELIQRLIKAHLGIGNSEAADQWQIVGLNVFGQLLNAQPTSLQKRELEAEFSDFSRVAVDSLIAQGKTILALETAERVCK